MKCEIAKDLIVLYVEDLCSTETAKEVEAHLVQCKQCSECLERYKKELCEQGENLLLNDLGKNIADLKPMKKVKSKLVFGKIKLIVLCLILLLIIGGVGILGYGQMTNACLSFSAISDAIRIKTACNELTEGNTEPFMELLATRMEDGYVVNGIEGLEDVETYKACVEEGVKEAYTYYFAGKDVEVKMTAINQYPYAEASAADEIMTDFTIAFYEKDELLYEMAFGKVSADKFIVYELPQNGEVGFTTRILPYYDTSLDVCLHHATRKSYNNLIDGKSEKSGAGLALAVTKYGTDEERNDFRDRIIEDMQSLCDAGWYYKEVMYSVDEYDKDAEKWIYKVWFMIENQSNGEIVMVEQRFHYYEEQLYAIEESPAKILVGAMSVPENIQNALIYMFQ